MRNQRGNTCAIFAVLGLLLAAGITLILMFSSGFKAGNIPKLVPDNTAIYASVDLARFAKTSKLSVKLMGEENYRKYFDETLEFVSEILEIDAKELWEKLTENLGSWVGAEAAIAVSSEMFKGEDPKQFAIIVAVRKPKIAAEKFVELVDYIAELEPSDKKVEWETDKHEGVEVSCFNEVCFCIIKNALFIAPSDYIEDLIDFNQDKKAKSLADTDHFKRVKKSMGKDVLFYATVNIELFHDMFEQGLSEAVEQGAPKDLMDEYKPLQSAVLYLSMDNKLKTEYKLAVLMNPDELKGSDILSGLDIDGHITIKGPLLVKINEWTMAAFGDMEAMFDEGEEEENEEAKMMKDLMEYNKAMYEAIESYTLSGGINSKEGYIAVEVKLDPAKFKDFPWSRTKSLFQYFRKALAEYKRKAAIGKCEQVIYEVMSAEQTHYAEYGEYAEIDELIEQEMLFDEMILQSCDQLDAWSDDVESWIEIDAVPTGYTEEECYMYMYVDEYDYGYVDKSGSECGWDYDDSWEDDSWDNEDMELQCDIAMEEAQDFIDNNPDIIGDLVAAYEDQVIDIENRYPFTDEDAQELESVKMWLWYDILWEADVNTDCADYYMNMGWEPPLYEYIDMGEPQEPDDIIEDYPEIEGQEDIVVAVTIEEDADGAKSYTMEWYTPDEIQVSVYSLTVRIRGMEDDPDAIMWQVVGIPADVNYVEYGVIPEGAEAGLVVDAIELAPEEYDVIINAYSEAYPDYSDPDQVTATGSNWLWVW